MQVALDYQARRLGSVTGGAELSPVDPARRPAFLAGEYLCERDSSRGEQKLVHVDERDPARIVSVAGHTVGVRFFHPRPVGPIDDLDCALADVRRENFGVLVLAAVVVEKESLDAYQQVELDPLGEIRRLIAVEGTNREVVR